MRQPFARLSAGVLLALMLAWIAGILLHPLTHHPLEASNDCFVCTLQHTPAHSDNPSEQILRAIAPPTVDLGVRVLSEVPLRIGLTLIQPLIPRAPPA